jgi:DNA polymerase III delta prime subunit
MRTITIFDGPDRVGKTNMAQALAREIGVTYFKNQDEHKYFLKDPNYFIHAIRYVDTYFASYLEASSTSIIMDRAWPSEWVYSKALGRLTDDAVLKELDVRHANLGTRIIVPLRTDYSSVKDEYDIVNDNIWKIHDLYVEFTQWTSCSCLKLNVDDEDLDRELTEIRHFISK